MSPPAMSLPLRHAPRYRLFHRSPPRLNVRAKYADKLQKVADEAGKTVEELRERARARRSQEPVTPDAARLVAAQNTHQRNATGALSPASGSNVRRDSSPVKPLAALMDLQKLLATPHTAAQVAALWTAFHASRTGGTGRGFLAAVIPLETYTAMTAAAQKYPSFVLALPRAAPAEPDPAPTRAPPAVEFHFLQWAFHAAPPHPALLAPPPPPNPPLSTVLLAPLGAYKLRGAFAAPQLVLTHYTDLAHTHGVVLLRGELTPAQSGGFLLAQHDAHLLALGVQRFYLAGVAAQEDAAARERVALLHAFHESPQEFGWESLLRHADPTS